ncbi:hypothetical protein [Dyadobacter chenhuakuii]|uniref:Uncharacterized protein n=1 Tax=Dyadobacter chenhuakuii TaxID=2909339 RepID=A0ABY4XI20_9BACT|nr:hypothetical protein [Dyadobacter chenhuakuii]MCF2495608.1 hypothetical protein [Dyadobacter chenhuakuii]USJ29642.1 hypothetical protein NFI80_17365 [Dyadobacter chenhuakuii]
MEENNDYHSEYSEFQRAQKMWGFKNQDSLDFTPYFRYEIGASTHPYHLSFPEKPSRIRYQNDIVNYLCYFGSVEEAIECLEYHYTLFEEKDKFLRYFKFSLPARIQLTSKKEDKIRLQICLDWIVDIYESYKMEPIYIGARAEIKGEDRNKILRLFSFLFNEIKNPDGPQYAMKGSSLGTAIILHQFEVFKKSALSSLQKDAVDIKKVTQIPPKLQEELRAFFYGSANQKI